MANQRKSRKNDPFDGISFSHLHRNIDGVTEQQTDGAPVRGCGDQRVKTLLRSFLLTSFVHCDLSVLCLVGLAG